MERFLPQQPLSRPLLCILFVLLLCLMPFVTKAFNIDDTLFLAAARQIQQAPTDFYGFTINWYGTQLPMSEITKNPPLASYYLAAAASLWGWSETALHLAFFLPAFALSAGTFLLAGRLCSQPLLATMVGIATPVFLVCASSIMCDVLMLAFWVWAVYFWLIGLDGRRTAFLAISAVLIAAAGLTKYFGICLIPLLLCYSLLERRSLGIWLFFLVWPAAIFIAYEWLTDALYGRGLLSDAGSYATAVTSLLETPFLEQLLMSLSFTGGCLIPFLFFAPLLWSKKVWIWGSALLISGVFAIHLTYAYLARPEDPLGGFAWGAVAQVAVFVTIGVSILGTAVLDLRRQRTPEAYLLFLWIAGTYLFAGFLNWTINGRTILPMVPAAGIVLVRTLSARRALPSSPRRWAFLLLPSLVLSLLVLYADSTFANASRRAAETIIRDTRGSSGTLWFLGHWGFQYYMERSGARALDVNLSALRPGDLVAVPSNNSNDCVIPPEVGTLQRSYTFQPFGLLATMNAELGAGFYANIDGPLPYAFGPVPEERFEIYGIHR